MILFNYDLCNSKVTVSNRLYKGDEKLALLLRKLHIKIDGIGIDGVRLHINMHVRLLIFNKCKLDDLLYPCNNVYVNGTTENEPCVLCDKDRLGATTLLLFPCKTLTLEPFSLFPLPCRFSCGVFGSFAFLADPTLLLDSLLLLNRISGNLRKSCALCLLDPCLLGNADTCALLFLLAGSFLLKAALLVGDSLIFLCQALFLAAARFLAKLFILFAKTVVLGAYALCLFVRFCSRLFLKLASDLCLKLATQLVLEKLACIGLGCFFFDFVLVYICVFKRFVNITVRLLKHLRNKCIDGRSVIPLTRVCSVDREGC